MRMTVLYYCLAATGLLVPWYFNIAYLAGGGSLSPGPFTAAVTANALTTAITWDVYIAAAAASAWMIQDARRRGRRHLGWVHAMLCFAVGLAFALPLYLARRENEGA